MKLKQWQKHILCDCKFKLNSTTRDQNQKWNNKTCQCEYKNYHKCKKDYSWNPITCIFENSKYLKNRTDTSVIACGEIISVMYIVSTKIANTIETNVTKNWYSEKVRDCYILHTVLLVIILLLIVTIILYYYTKYRSKKRR